MELQLGAEDAAFRDEVRDFIRENLAPDMKRKVELGQGIDKEDTLRWHRTLLEQGWAAPNWPEEFGGPGWSPMQKHIFDVELAAGSAPQPMPFGLAMIGPLIIKFGSDEQKKRYLPRIVAGEDWWCQGYSETGAGSDLASLQTKAVRDGDRYIVNGAKTWTTLAQFANMMFCLVRTSSEGKRQAGITFLLVDMTAPGITVRPIRTMDGGHEINEVFFDDVRVPVENLIGEEGKGFQYLLHGFNPERILVGAEAVGIGQRAIELASRYAQDRVVFGRPIGQNQGIQHPLADSWMALEAAWLACLRGAWAYDCGQPCGAEANAAKYLGAEAAYKACERAVMTHGGMGYARDFHVERLWREVLIPRIAPVSPQLILCYIAERVLGLPRSY